MSELESAIRAAVNEVEDPCSVAHGAATGLADMGLLVGVELEGPESARRVRLRMRLTAPGCFYFVYFEQEIRWRLQRIESIAAVEFEWESRWDWTPEAISPQAPARRMHALPY